MDIKGLLKIMVGKDASDLHLKVGRPPALRIKRELIPQDLPNLSGEELKKMAELLMNEHQKEQFEKKREIDFAYCMPEGGRFRTNIFRQRGEIGIVMRRIREDIPSFEELGLPPVLNKIALSERGIVLVTGTSSSGKSTTLAAMIDYINSNKRRHIMTIEDPIEYLHKDKLSIINQREVGLDTESFKVALRHVIRQDPDIILIGEMRDEETFLAAMSASETGHLVFSTLHSTDATQVIDRILDFFPQTQHQQIRMQLAFNLKAVICQRLIPRTSRDGLIPAVEVLFVTPAVAKLIRENRLGKLVAAMQSGTEDGMQTFNMSLVKLINNKLITLEDALARATNPEGLKMNLKGIYLDEDRKILGE